MRKAVLATLIVIVSISSTAHIQTRLDEVRKREFSSELLYVPNEKLLSYSTAGQGSVIASMLWLRCIQYVSFEFRREHKFVWLEHMCQTITRLDPNFADVYRYGGIFLSSMKSDDDGSLNLLKSGIVSNPDNWELPWEAAMVYLVNRRDRPDSPAIAARYLAMSLATGNAPEKVRLAAEGLGLKYGLFEVEREMWLDTIESKDPGLRELGRKKLVETTIRQSCAVLSEATKTYAMQFGQFPATIERLVATNLVSEAPQDSTGGTYFVSPDGSVRSTTIQQSEYEERLVRLKSSIERFSKNLGRFPSTLVELADSPYLFRIPKYPFDGGDWQYDPEIGSVK